MNCTYVIYLIDIDISQRGFHKALETCPLPNNDFIVKIFDYRGGNIKVNCHDVLIHIPENAIAAGDFVEMKAGACLIGPYKLPESYERVSALVWVSVNYKFQKNVQLYLQYFYAANSEEDIKDLCLLTASESDKQRWSFGHTPLL